MADEAKEPKKSKSEDGDGEDELDRKRKKKKRMKDQGMEGADENRNITTQQTEGVGMGPGERGGGRRRTARGLALSAEADNSNEIEQKKKKIGKSSSSKIAAEAGGDNTQRKSKKEERKKKTASSSSSSSAQLRFDVVDVNNKKPSELSGKLNKGGSERHQKRTADDELGEEHRMDGRRKELLSNVSTIGGSVLRLGSSVSSSAATINSTTSTTSSSRKKALPGDEQAQRQRQLQRAIVADDPHKVAEAINLGADVNFLYKNEVTPPSFLIPPLFCLALHPKTLSRIMHQQQLAQATNI
jgi:hypothetical protein